MAETQTITLYFKRADGEREKATLTVHTLREAQNLIRRIFRIAPGLYREVEIRIKDRFIETIRNRLAKARPP
jgi:hypothetical protein